jgi:hypothetical protein
MGTRRRLGWAVLLGSPVAAWAAAPATAPAPPGGPEVARLTYVEQRVQQGASGSLRDAREGEPVRIGEQLRTASDAMLRVDFPWMAMSVSASSVLQFPDEPFLQGVLGQGRVALVAEDRDILKLLTAEAEVRGQGRVVVQRQEPETRISNLDGAFSVEGSGTVLGLPSGTGAIVRAGQPPAGPIALPPAPVKLIPGTDPVYVAPGQPVRLRWSARAAAYHVEVLAVGSDTVLVERDVKEPALDLEMRWPGAFRWRVSSRDARGLEGPPSRDGFFCVD